MTDKDKDMLFWCYICTIVAIAIVSCAWLACKYNWYYLDHGYQWIPGKSGHWQHPTSSGGQ